MWRKHQLIIFFALAFAISWAVFIPMVVFDWPIQVTAAATFGPCFAALIAQRLSAGNFRAFRLFGSLKRTTLASCFGILLVVATFVVLPAVVTAPASKLNWRVLIALNVYNYSTLLGGPLGEEFGWRGYALPRLEERFGPIGGTIVLAVFWACWHLPLFLKRGWTTAPFWIYFLLVASLGFVFTVAVNYARFAVFPAILIHATFNTASRFLNGLFANVQPSSRMPFELVMALCGLAVALVLTIITGGTLGYPKPAGNTPALPKSH
jgi:membrane protease YdiL (CAAX protease family)